MSDKLSLVSEESLDDILDDLMDDTSPETSEEPIPRQGEVTPSPKSGWIPDKEVMDELIDEFKPAIFRKEDVKLVEDPVGTRNITDDVSKDAADEYRNDQDLMLKTIEAAKKKLGIVKLAIPPGPLQTKVFDVADDKNNPNVVDDTTEVLRGIVEKFPEVVVERYTDVDTIDPKEAKVSDNVDQKETPETDTPSVAETPDSRSEEQPLVINVEKTEAPKIVWSEEDLAKIKKARRIELDIVESSTLNFGEIEDLDGSAVDAVLGQYVRKMNDVTAPLPASRYRATFTGLSYPEILDLSHSIELNNADGERKKWTIAFKHITNPSIGPFTKYKYYIDPKTRKKVVLPFETSDDQYPDHELVTVTEFDDFLRKTSFHDLQYILWKILCATTMENELINITCHHKLASGKRCGTEHDWMYSPSEMLDAKDILPVILEEMNQVANASSRGEIEKLYNESLLVSNSVVELPESKISIIFGHISAYEYLNNVRALVENLRIEGDDYDPSDFIARSMLFVSKGFLLKKSDGKTVRIKDVEGMVKIIKSLGIIDSSTLGEVIRKVIDPYKFKYSIRDVVCPQCGSRNDMDVNDIATLLFIVTQGLQQSVHVTLKKS